LFVPVRLRAAVFASDDAAAAGVFWAKLLDRQVIDDPDGLLVPGDDTQLGLRFVPRPAQRTYVNRMHVHLTSTSLEHQQGTVARALELGARPLDVGQRPEEQHVVLADPGGNAFCVIEPGNSFLADCGFLGELACDGSRDVGVFWSAALGWPLVWDQDQETAIQSPLGGTKVAWGGARVLPLAGEVDAQQLDIVVTKDDFAAELDRLIALGATPLTGTDPVVLTDPDDVPFRISSGWR
jgi:hypothetical protein